MAGGAAAVGATYPVAIETQWLDLTTTGVRLALPRRVRVLHLTDLHASWAVPMALIERAVRLGLDCHPDLICLTGDFITHKSDFDADHLSSLIGRLAASTPTYAVLGNHDGGSWAGARKGHSDHMLVEQILRTAGVTLLHNRAAEFAAKGMRLHLVGVGDLWANELDAHQAFRSVPRNAPVLLLSHNPDSKDQLAAFDWNLMLCGHTHGGQVMVPFEGPRYAPVRDRRFVAGLHPWGNRQIFTLPRCRELGQCQVPVPA
jgi:uncharacterized protein